MRTTALLVFVAGFLLAGCGTPGAPLPPSLNIPKPVKDLKAVRKGDGVTITWTAPQDTTDGALLKHPGKMMLERALQTMGSSASTPAKIADLPLPPALKNKQGKEITFKDSLAQFAHDSADFAVYTVVSVSNEGKGAGPSNQAAVPLAPVPPPPRDMDVKVVAQGVAISWEQPWPAVNPAHLTAQYLYRIMRRQQGAKDSALVKEIALGNSAVAVVDTGIEWEKQYQYWVTPLTRWEAQGQKGEIEGEDSPIVAIEAHDTFPPAAPTGLQAVFSGVTQQAFIDLTWTPNTEPDLAGYNVYRRSQGAQPVRINKDLVKSPAFRDAEVQPGNKYLYSVSAVDLRGNESGKSQEASETVPSR